ncbi:UNVERIFIED_CONTAM: hypothetical protein GTU68_054651 [Idotea baltica]|nr:hypothetical protein [Idotea baltica]
MSQAVVHGDTVYLAGQVAQNAKGASISDQTKDILAAIENLLSTCGSDKANILSATIWLTSMDDFAEMNAVWDAWVDTSNPPARAAVESPRLATADFQVEIMITAAVK